MEVQRRHAKTNTNTLLGHDGFVGMKTGSGNAADGFMFRSERHTESGNVTLIVVVLGQQGPDLIATGLYAAQQLADRVASNAATPETSSRGRIVG